MTLAKLCCPACGFALLRSDGLVAIHFRHLSAGTAKSRMERCPGSLNPYPVPRRKD